MMGAKSGVMVGEPRHWRFTLTSLKNGNMSQHMRGQTLDEIQRRPRGMQLVGIERRAHHQFPAGGLRHIDVQRARHEMGSSQGFTGSDTMACNGCT